MQVEQLGHLLGCVVSLRTSVTGITIVALGTSLPDTFASRSAAIHDDSADASIGKSTAIHNDFADSLIGKSTAIHDDSADSSIAKSTLRPEVSLAKFLKKKKKKKGPIPDFCTGDLRRL